MKEKGLNDNKVTLALNLSIGVIGKSRMEKRDLSRKAVAKILEYYNDLDPIWLTTGEGTTISTNPAWAISYMLEKVLRP